ncbi:chymotrypsin inhibitor-like [Ceratina calcarata]|uniref:Chymotrypsin inhibitor-like n=1 Tax=Ceratina calcarata TaxID=156304 RepID=A0AAJ7NDY6_9HYME|nr:chymotrypsin inhibitor-like [Ceratina calcarata]
MSNFVVAIALFAGLFVAFQGEVAGQQQSCPPNEALNLCGTMCEPTCDNPNPNPRFCPRLQCTIGTQACRCISGTYRNANSQCVPLDQCLSYRD